MPQANGSVLKPPTRTIGFWMSAPLAGLRACNVGRAIVDPAGFAASMGVALLAAENASWAWIYGLWRAFIALLVKWTALAALLMPLGDAWIAPEAGAAAATVAHYGVTAFFLLLATIALFMASGARAQ